MTPAIAPFASVADAIPLHALRRILVTKLRHHGDVLLTSPVITALRNHCPDAEVDALVYADTAPMLSLHPGLTQLHTVDRGWKKLGALAQARAEWGLLSRLRARRYDLIVHLTEHPRGAWLARATGARWAVGPRRPGTFWRKSFTHQYASPAHARRHTVERNLDALRRLGLQPSGEDRRLTLIAGPEADVRIDTLLAEAGLHPQGFIHLHPASRWLFKCWPVEHNAALVRSLVERGAPVVLTAAPDARETALVAAIVEAAGVPVLNLAGQLSLKELAALSARARLFVGVDSAPMHMAAAVLTPTVALFGPSGEYEWHPWRVPHVVVASDHHPCRPCGLDGCGGGKVSDCLAHLPVAQVLAAVDALLGADGG